MTQVPRTDPAREAGVVPGAGEAPAATRSRVLVVDDYPMNCELIEAMLVPAGYRVESVYSGADALASIAAHPPDLVLLDVSMPEMDGFEVAKRLRAAEETRLIPIVMVTALGDLEHRVRGIESGAEDYLAKPVNRMELLARVQSTLRVSYYRRQVDERQKLDLVLADVSDGIVIMDEDGNLREINTSARRLLGLDGDSHVSRIEELWSAFLDVPADVVEVVRHGRATDFVVRRSDPQLFISVSLRPVHDLEGSTTGSVLSLRDVTREMLEHKLQEDALSLVSHKFRTPLTVVGLWTKLLLDQECGPVTEQQREALEAMTQASEQLRRLLEGMLSYLEWTKRLHRVQRQPMTFTELETNLRHRVQGEIGTENRLVIERLAEGELVVDEDLFVQVLAELVHNAIKFRAGKSIEIRIRIRSTDRGCEIIVEDTGPGIPPEKLERIFERFYQVESDFTGQIHGIGLGLALVKTAVEAMGGQVRASSQLGRGTRFVIQM
jgi:two-component system cell cycle response regulator